QLPRQGVNEAVALAHQHENVAGGDWPALALDRLLLLNPTGNSLGNIGGKANGGRRGMVDGLGPIVGRLHRLRANGRPDLDIAGRGLSDRQVPKLFRIAGQPLSDLWRRKSQVDSRKDVGDRAEGMEKPHPLEAGADTLDGFGETIAAQGEG